jgi:preprotein translocase subunit SecG
MYIGYIQFFLIAFVFLKDFKGGHLGGLIFKYAIISIPIALILFIFLSLLLGYMDTKLGFREEELRNLSKSNPMMVEMLDSLKEIKEKISLLDEKRNKNTL